ncbi:MAG: energy-coupling factor transporter ATPase, partial [Clostridia bacterium]|nr:energy-coupling factor transporter ATPase [Clostridia bacterium]
MEAVKFEQVYFSYEDAKVEENDGLFSSAGIFALRGVDFTVEEGEFVAILGHNGSGKSTLARLTNGLLSASSGKITALGLDVSEEKNLFDIRRQVGIVFQNPDNQTVASIVEDDVAFGPENVGVEREEIGKRIEFALKAVGMEEYRHSTPTRLSGGQKQRIAIAGVLALKPRVMILDEATAMLDPRGRKEVMDVVLKLNREEKITVILITHFAEEAMLADRAVVMHQGQIVMQGRPNEIFSQGAALEKYALVEPRPMRICRGLTAGGISVSDTMDEEILASWIAECLSALKEVKMPENIGAGIRSRDITGEENGRIVAENLSFVYNPKSPFATQALEGVDLEISDGEFFGIIGHTGSGKSTFVQHLNALLKVPSAEKKYKEKKIKKGQVKPPKTTLRVAGFDLTDKKTDFRLLRSKVGMVFQYPEYQLFAETVREDVAFALKNFYPDLKADEVEDRVCSAIEIVGLNYDNIK